MSSESYVVDLEAVRAAAARIAPRTPIETSSTMDRLSGHQLFFKCELFQTTGSFKVGVK